MAAQVESNKSGPTSSVTVKGDVEERLGMYTASVKELFEAQKASGASEQVMLQALQGLARVAAESSANYYGDMVAKSSIG